jgi:hypothetical protein
MKRAIGILSATLAFAGFALAGETTLKGRGVCARCDLGETSACQSALEVTNKAKRTEVYYVEGAAGKELHRYLCNGPKEGVVLTGSAREKDGRKWISGKLLAPRD